MKKIKTALLAGAALLAATGVQAQNVTFQGDVISFGDSLSDNGNLFSQIGAANAFPGSNRFVNPGGLTWIELLLGGQPDPTGTNAVSPQNSPFQGTGITGNVNLAFGGAVAGPGTPGGILDLGEQFAFFAANGGTIDATDTVTYWAGANNFFAGLPTVTSAADAALLGQNVGTLAVNDLTSLATGAIIPGNGPGQIIAVSLPNLASLPGTNANAAGAAALARAAALAGGASVAQADAAAATASAQVLAAANLAGSTYNQVLRSGFDALAAANPTRSFVFLDAAAVFDEIIANPQAFGFDNVTVGCVFDATCVSASFEDQNRFLFSDGVHPTNAGYAILAELARQTLLPTIGAASVSGLADAPLADRQFVAGRALDRARSFFLQPRTNDVSSSADIDTLNPEAKNLRGEGFIEALGGTTTIAARGVTPQVQSDIVGFRLGADIFKTENFVFGAQTAFTTGKGRQPQVEFEPNSISIDAYAAARIGNAFAALSVGAAFLDISNIERSVGVGPLTNDASTEGRQFNVLGEVGYDFELGGLKILPTLSLGYFNTTIDGYTETGVFAPLTFGDRRINALTGAAKLRVAKNFVTGDNKTGRVFAGVGYEDYLTYNANALTVSALASTAPASSLSVTDPSGRGFVFDVGARFDFNESIAISADYEFGMGRNNTQSHRGGLQLIAKF